MDPLVRKDLGMNGFGSATLDGNEHWLVVLVAVVIEHQQDLPKLGEHVVGVAPHEGGVLQDHIGRDEGLRHAASLVHGVQAQMTAQVADEEDALADDLRDEEEAGREHGFDLGVL